VGIGQAGASGSRAVRGAVPLLLAALLAGAAFVTVDRAGCDTPGRYVTTVDGAELLGGCVAPAAVPGVDHADAERG